MAAKEDASPLLQKWNDIGAAALHPASILLTRSYESAHAPTL